MQVEVQLFPAPPFPAKVVLASPYPMPGITGYILSQLADDNGRLLDQMVLSMCHDSSLSSGKHRHSRLGLGIGWTCHRGSYADCMPIWNENHDIVLFFSGEHYAVPRKTSVGELPATGVRWMLRGAWSTCTRSRDRISFHS